MKKNTLKENKKYYYHRDSTMSKVEVIILFHDSKWLIHSISR